MSRPKACTCEHYKAKEPHEYTCNMNINQHTKKRDSMEKATAGTWKTEIWNYDKATPPRKEIAIQTDKMRIAVLDCDFTGDNPYTIPEEEAHANAALIVRAVNSHEALIEALEELLHGNPDRLAYEQAETVLKLAKGA